MHYLMQFVEKPQITSQQHKFSKRQKAFTKNTKKQQKQQMVRKNNKNNSDDQSSDCLDQQILHSKDSNVKFLSINEYNDNYVDKKRITNSFPQDINLGNGFSYQNSVKASSSQLHHNESDDRKKSVFAKIQVQQDCKILKYSNWCRTKLIIQQNKMSFFQFSFEVHELQKIKIIPKSSSLNKLQNIIKMVISNKVTLISVSILKKVIQLPLAYYLFSRLIDKKIQSNTDNYKYETQKIQKIQTNITNDSFIYGNILKKSQSLGKWQQRLVVIKKNGIYSYRNKNAQNCSFFIGNQNIKYLWTRFHLVNDFLVIKIKHGVQKTQFGIPITMFSNRTGRNWLYSFYRIIPVPNVVQVTP